MHKMKRLDSDSHPRRMQEKNTTTDPRVYVKLSRVITSVANHNLPM